MGMLGTAGSPRRRGRMGAAAVARTREILPRLDYARGLVGDVHASLLGELRRLSRRNRQLDSAAARASKAPGAALGAPHLRAALEPASLGDELAVRTAVLATIRIRSQLAGMQRADFIPRVVPAILPAIRHVSSALYPAYPLCSARLCEASSVLGGVLADSAVVTAAKIDFDRSNAVSSALLAQAKLTSKSKIAKLYPNLQAACH